MPNRAKLFPAFLVLSASLAACSSAASSSAGAPAAAPAAKAKAAASTAAAVSALAACKALLVWENSDDAGSVADNAQLSDTFKDTDQPLSGDFARWTRDIRADPSLDNANADRVSGDCAAWGVDIFGSPSDSASPSAPDAAPPDTAPSPATPTKVEFIVSGTAPDGINITYGPSGSNYAGPTALNGTATMSVPFDGQASYYHLQAQLQGSGSIKCKIVVTGPGDEPLTVSSGGASGGFNICDAQAAPEDSSGLQWENEE